jgi:hypothetical protein
MAATAPLFSGVRRRGILRTSPERLSRKFGIAPAQHLGAYRTQNCRAIDGRPERRPCRLQEPRRLALAGKRSRAGANIRRRAVPHFAGP